MSNEARRTIEAKTAAYSVVFPSDNGKFFTNRGDGDALTFTLPAVTAALEGSWCEFHVVAGQNVAIAGTAGQLVTFNDAAANSVTFSTANELIGAHATAVCDGTSWLIILSTEETQTATVAT